MNHHIRLPVQRKRPAQIEAMVVGQIAGATTDAANLDSRLPLKAPQERTTDKTGRAGHENAQAHRHSG